MNSRDVFTRNINKLLKTNNLTQQDIVDKLEISSSTISDWFNGKKFPRIDKLQMLVDYFGVNISDLVENQAPTFLSRRLPLYSELSCGQGIFVDDNIEEYIALPESLLSDSKEYFCQFAVGDSMIDENIVPGDLLVFEKTQHIENGQIGVFCIDDNVATCKKFYHDEVSNIITLQPANSKYAPIIVTIESMSFHVVGKLSLVINKRD